MGGAVDLGLALWVGIAARLHLIDAQLGNMNAYFESVGAAGQSNASRCNAQEHPKVTIRVVEDVLVHILLVLADMNINLIEYIRNTALSDVHGCEILWS